jgi:head-tail adaptor
VTHRIWFRRIEGVNVGMRFRKGSRIFEIRTVHDPDERGRYLVAHVTEM